MAEMTENSLQERLQLISERLTGLLMEETDPFWHACFGIISGREKSVISYMRYTDCREKLGHKQGVYLCVLYAQLAQTAQICQIEGLSEKQSVRELKCVTCELAVQIYLMVREQDSPEEIRDVLYWFYVDYCPLMAEVWQCMLEKECLSFGGPMLFGAAGQEALWKEHRWDCGLYLGKRFMKQFLQTLGGSAQELIQAIETLLPGKPEPESGFILTTHQKAIWQELLEQIELLIK